MVNAMLRFSIRDILRLTAIVALALALYTAHLQMARQTARFELERSEAKQAAALAIAQMQTRINELRTQNLQQEHRFHVQLASERKRHAEDLQRLAAEASANITRINQAAAIGSSIDLAAEPRD